MCNKSRRFPALQQIPPCLLSSPDIRPSALCEVFQINARQPAAIGQTKQVNTKCRLVVLGQHTGLLEGDPIQSC